MSWQDVKDYYFSEEVLLELIEENNPLQWRPQSHMGISQRYATNGLFLAKPHEPYFNSL